VSRKLLWKPRNGIYKKRPVDPVVEKNLQEESRSIRVSENVYIYNRYSPFKMVAVFLGQA